MDVVASPPGTVPECQTALEQDPAGGQGGINPQGVGQSPGSSHSAPQESDTIQSLKEWWMSLAMSERMKQESHAAWSKRALALIEHKGTGKLEDKCMGELLGYALRGGHWAVVCKLLHAGVTEECQREAFSRVAGAHVRLSFSPGDADHMALMGDDHASRQARCYKLALDAISGHEEDNMLQADCGVELPTWMLAKCIALPGDGGSRLLRSYLVDRDGCVMWSHIGRPHDSPSNLLSNAKSIAIPEGADSGQYVPDEKHDQMAYMGHRPRTVVIAQKEKCDEAQHMLLPHRLDLLPVHEQSTLEKTRAHVCVFTLRGVVCPEVVKALAEAPNNDPLTTDAAHAIIHHAWTRFRTAYIADVVLHFLYVFVLVATTIARHESAPVPWHHLILLGLMTGKNVLEEVLQFASTDNSSRTLRCLHGMVVPRQITFAIQYIFSWEQLTDWVWIAIDVVGIRISAEHQVLTDPTWPWYARSRLFLAIWDLVRWLRALYCLRGTYYLGTRMLPILFALRDTLVFAFVLILVLLGSVHAYYELHVSSRVPDVWYTSFLNIVRLGLLGDFDLLELEGVEEEAAGDSVTSFYVPVHIVFYFVVLTITISLMNLFIGVLSSNYDRFEDQRLPIFLRSRAKIMVRYQTRPWARQLARWHECHGYLWCASRATANLDEERSIRTVIREEIRQAMAHLATDKPRLASQGLENTFKREGLSPRWTAQATPAPTPRPQADEGSAEDKIATLLSLAQEIQGRLLSGRKGATS